MILEPMAAAAVGALAYAFRAKRAARPLPQHEVVVGIATWVLLASGGALLLDTLIP